MKITIDINDKDYTFEMNRSVYYKQLLQDEEYAKMQSEISKMAKEKNINEKNADKVAKDIEKEVQEELENGKLAETLLRNMVWEEQVFCHSLTTNHPELSWEERIALLDSAYDIYGQEAVTKLTMKLMENFIQRGDQKKKMVMKIG